MRERDKNIKYSFTIKKISYQVTSIFQIIFLINGDEVESNSNFLIIQYVTRSADDLDDNFELEDEKEFMLAYDKHGKPLVPENVLKDFTGKYEISIIFIRKSFKSNVSVIY